MINDELHQDSRTASSKQIQSVSNYELLINLESVPSYLVLEIVSKCSYKTIARLLRSTQTISRLVLTIGHDKFPPLKIECLYITEQKRILLRKGRKYQLTSEENIQKALKIKTLKMEYVNRKQAGKHLQWLKKHSIKCEDLIFQDVSEEVILKATDLLRPKSLEVKGCQRTKYILKNDFLMQLCITNINDVAVYNDQQFDLKFPTKANQRFSIGHPGMISKEELHIFLEHLLNLDKQFVQLRFSFEGMGNPYFQSIEKPNLIDTFNEMVFDSNLIFIWNWLNHKTSMLKDIETSKLIRKKSLNYYYINCKDYTIGISSISTILL